MIEFADQIKQEVFCPIRNCILGISIGCYPNELNKSLLYGNYSITRKAFEPDLKSCDSFATTNVKISYDDRGRAIGYEFPHTDPNIILKFILMVTLVPYGSDLQNIFNGTSSVQVDNKEWEEIRNSFAESIKSASKFQRRLFPPDPIIYEGKQHEVSGICVCQNPGCVYHEGDLNIKSFKVITNI